MYVFNVNSNSEHEKIIRELANEDGWLVLSYDNFEKLIQRGFSFTLFFDLLNTTARQHYQEHYADAQKRYNDEWKEMRKDMYPCIWNLLQYESNYR